MLPALFLAFFPALRHERHTADEIHTSWELFATLDVSKPDRTWW